ncbi:hypothetical protein TKK_0004963 [Trichogramma kaykai]|uniref:Proteasome assembly chaperone 2 n=1 Tax=Trichogramma kaykai TaxID=54128 RepID=A0ABD2XKB0_9HYME
MIKLLEEVDLSGYTLILPSVSVGNVGQLSVDLVIATLGLKRIGRLFDPAFIPLVGADPYDENSEDICTAVDIYVCREKKLIAIQIRSPLVKRPINFLKTVSDFISEKNISKVIILTSSFGHEKRDIQLRTAPLRYLATNTLLEQDAKTFEDLSWIALEPKPIDDFSNQTSLQIHGGGFAKILFEILQKNKVPCVVIMKYCSEGDNIPDAIELTNYFNQYAKLIDTDSELLGQFKYPCSWKFLFGNSPPKEIF